jgi:hypothetical protein
MNLGRPIKGRKIGQKARTKDHSPCKLQLAPAHLDGSKRNRVNFPAIANPVVCADFPSIRRFAACRQCRSVFSLRIGRSRKGNRINCTIVKDFDNGWGVTPYEVELSERIE